MVPRKGGPNGFSVSYEFENWDSEIARVRAQCSVVYVCVCVCASDGGGVGQ